MRGADSIIYIKPNIINQYNIKLYLNVIFLQIHRQEKNYECQICHLKFRHKNSMVRHMFRHNGRNRLNCQHCNHSFATLLKLKSHIENCHNEKKSANEKVVSENSFLDHNEAQPFIITQPPLLPQISFSLSPAIGVNGQTILMQNFVLEANTLPLINPVMSISPHVIMTNSTRTITGNSQQTEMEVQQDLAENVAPISSSLLAADLEEEEQSVIKRPELKRKPSVEKKNMVEIAMREILDNNTLLQNTCVV